MLILKSEDPIKPEAPVTEAAADNTNTTSTNNLTLTPPQLLAHIQKSAHKHQLDSELIHVARTQYGVSLINSHRVVTLL